MMTMEPATLTAKGYDCFKLYFLRVNESLGRIQIKSTTTTTTAATTGQVDELDASCVVESAELVGLDHLWDIILHVHEERIAERAVKFLLDMVCERLSVRMRREQLSDNLHQRFIDECYARLEQALYTLDKNCVGRLLLNAFAIAYSSVGLHHHHLDKDHAAKEDQALNDQMDAQQQEEEEEEEAAAIRFDSRVPLPPHHTDERTLRSVERLLMCAERYILNVEEGIALASRAHPPHFLTFKAEAFVITCEFTSTSTNSGVFETSEASSTTNSAMANDSSSNANNKSAASSAVVRLCACANDHLGEIRQQLATAAPLLVTASTNTFYAFQIYLKVRIFCSRVDSMFLFQNCSKESL